MSDRFLIIGAGGHGKVVADAIRATGGSVVGYLDDADDSIGKTILGAQVLGNVASWTSHPHDYLVVAIGNNITRRRIAEKLRVAAGQLPWGAVIHPAATVAPSAQLGPGTVVMAGAVINPDCIIGEHIIVNTGATIDHDCVINSYAHIAPGAHLAGGVRVGEGALVGIGAAVTPGMEIGSNAVVGAGAVVVRNVPPNVTAIGIPARW